MSCLFGSFEMCGSYNETMFPFETLNLFSLGKIVGLICFLKKLWFRVAPGHLIFPVFQNFLSQNNFSICGF